jgi:uncharacterized membrane protein YhfC
MPEMPIIPQQTLVCILIAACSTIIVPTALYLFWRKKYQLSIVPLAIGMMCYFVFVLLVEKQLGNYLLSQPAFAGFVSVPIVLAVYVGLMTGIFEESARFGAFHVLKKTYTGLGSPFAFGLGFAAFEGFFVLGVPLLQRVMVISEINSGNLDYAGGAEAALSFMTTIAALDPTVFLYGALERLPILAFQLALSVLVWLAVTRGKLKLLFLAVGLRILERLPAALNQIGLLASSSVVIFSCLLIIVLTVLIWRYYVRESQENPTIQLQKGD